MTTDDLRIGQFITQYPYENQFSGVDDYFCSGAERVAKRLSEKLAERGCSVTVCTSSATSEYTVEKQNGVTVERSPSLTNINTTQIAPSQIVNPITEGLDFDIVHAHNSTPPGVIAGWLYAKWNDVPFIITHHGGETYESHGSFFRRAGLFIYTKFLINSLFQAADVAVSPTEGYIQESSALSHAESVTVIPNGVDVDQFDIGVSNEEAKRQLEIDPESFLVLYVGSLHPRKGVDVLLNGFTHFHEMHPDTRLVIGGDGSLKKDLESTVEERNLSDVVQIPGFIPESKKSTYMNAADVFVLPSITAGSEVFPLVLLEAAAARTPVIASRFDTIESVVGPNKMGSLLEPGNVESVANELKRFYDDDEMRQETTENALRTAHNREWNVIAQQYHGLYRSVLE
ncbi:glycosyltransferase family 4 protein [Halobacterium salinarum]|uniref:glycosyltransferase family 4 protein n=1 Tax=Halobacterium salinarum TaxID=2242 RepID=UPI0025565BA3|nr:glycosyltransferase family 4 protein [Halobacterium salinarum]MDL0118810.1 glycosyltransferase family 4 protein [Halobacterium salinarum]